MRYVFQKIGEADLFRIMLTHENIPFTEGVGGGYVAFDVEGDLNPTVLLAVVQWRHAIDMIGRMVVEQHTK